jgi:hypothetical protein
MKRNAPNKDDPIGTIAEKIPVGKMSGKAAVAISDVKLQSSNTNPLSMTFSMSIDEDKLPVPMENCEVWVGVGNPITVKKIFDILFKEPYKGGTISAGNINQGWVVSSCSCKKNDGKPWICEVEFKDANLTSPVVPVTIALIGALGKFRNQIEVKIDFENGKLEKTP